MNCKCKHGLTVGTCWTCKTGKRIKPPKEIKGDGLFHGIDIKYPEGHDSWSWNWDAKRRAAWEETKERVREEQLKMIPKTPCDIG